MRGLFAGPLAGAVEAVLADEGRGRGVSAVSVLAHARTRLSLCLNMLYECGGEGMIEGRHDFDVFVSVIILFVLFLAL